jgi:hypothetical protein
VSPTRRTFLAALAALAALGSSARAEDLPFCTNRTAREVARRAGCTLADEQCWLSAGGFCTDWIEKRIREREKRTVRLVSVAPQEVAEGDVAVFVDRSHYAWVERVRRDAKGRPVAVDLSEYNFGTCWVDDDLLVTDRYGILHRRAAVPLAAVDGGFLRPRLAVR